MVVGKGFTVGADSPIGKYLKDDGSWDIPAGGGGGGGSYIDRGSFEAFDWTEATLTTDGNLHVLDCSSIIDAGAVAIAFICEVKDDVPGSWIEFRKNGASDWHITPCIRTQAGNIPSDRAYFVVPCDSNGKIQYSASNVVWTSIGLTIVGWYMSGDGGATNLFRVTKGDAQTFTKNVWQKVQFNTEVFDTGGDYDNVTNFRYTAPSAGKYFFEATASVMVSSAVLLISLFKNGATHAEGNRISHSTTCAVNVAAIIELDVNDYVECYVFVSSNANGTLDTTDASRNHFSGCKLA